jgi:hypothetical protein
MGEGKEGCGGKDEVVGSEVVVTWRDEGKAPLTISG